MSTSRHTDQRQAVLRAVKFSSEPLTAAAMLQRLRTAGLSRATLFRNLRRLVTNGEISAIEGHDGVTRYVGHAYHEALFRCQRCGRKRQLKSQTLPGYVDRKMFGRQSIMTSQLIAQGLCASCAKILKL